MKENVNRLQSMVDDRSDGSSSSMRASVRQLKHSAQRQKAAVLRQQTSSTVYKTVSCCFEGK
jgi:hypothetical protein